MGRFKSQSYLNQHIRNQHRKVVIENFIQCPICEMNFNGVVNLRMHWGRSKNDCKSGTLRFGAKLCQESTGRCLFNNEENEEDVANQTEANTTILEDQVLNRSQEDAANDFLLQISTEDIISLKAFFGKGLYQVHYTWRDAIAKLALDFISSFVDETRSTAVRRDAYLAFELLPGVIQYIRTNSPSLGKPLDMLNKLISHEDAASYLISKAMEWKSSHLCVSRSRQALNHNRALKIDKSLKSIERLIKDGRLTAATRRSVAVNEAISQQELYQSDLVSISPTIAFTEMCAQVQLLHPEANEMDVLSNEPVQIDVWEHVTSLEVKSHIERLNKDSSSGVSAWSNSLIRVIFVSGTAELQDQLLWHTTKWANLFFQGDMPAVICDLMVASRVVFIPKSDGTFRPLGIGEAWIRLFGRIISQKFAERLAIQLNPVQLCVGISGGCEIAARLADIYLSRPDKLGNPGFLKIDASNAFNEIRRGVIYDGLRSICPELCAVFRMLYGRSSYLLSTDGQIVGRSATGCRQGDPLSMIFFAIGFQSALQNVRSSLHQLEESILPRQRYHPGFVCAYADDVGVAADMDVLTELYPSLHEIYANIGLRISPKSTLVNLYDHPIQLVDRLTHVTDGTSFLGVPVGKREYKNDKFQCAINKLAPPAKVLKRLSSQYGIQLLSRCINRRPNYMCSICEVDNFWEILDIFDTSVDSSLADISGLSRLNEEQSQLRELPERFGGFGFNRLVGPFGARLRLMSRARVIKFGPSIPELREFILQMKDTHEFWQLTDICAVSRVFEHASVSGELTQNLDENDITYSSALRKIEHTYFKTAQSSLLDKKYQINDSTSLQEAAWLRSNSFHGSFRWANTNLSEGYIGSRWNSSIFQSALQIRLLSKFSDSRNEYRCRYCHSRNSSVFIGSTLHALSCNLNRGLRNIRHSTISSELQSLLKRVYPGITIENEPTICEAQDRVIRSDIRYFKDGAPIIIDVGIACPTAHISSASGFNSAYHECGAADEMENRKRTWMDNFVDRGFQPFVLESSGRLGRSASLFLNRICGDNATLRTSFLYNVSTYIAQESGRMLKFMRDKIDTS
jgi:hypothetical protein